MKHLYEFGPFRLDVAERLLLRNQQPVDLTAKVFDLLVLLLENPGKLLEKNYLLETLWPESFVEEVNLSVNVSALRKALGENAASPQYVETVPKRGYRFIGAVTVFEEPEHHPAPAAAPPGMIINHEQIVVAEPALVPAQKVSKRPLNPRLLLTGSAIVLAALVVAGYALWRARPSASDVAGGGATRTIAVLPFKTLTANDADEALGLGMADALITRLGSLQQVIVRPISTVLKYSDAGKDPLIVGRELGVEAVLDGRVQRDDKKIRVTAQLLRVRDGASLWSGKFDDFFTNVFALQDSISEKMTEALSLRLTKDQQQLMARRTTENTEAYQLFVQGRYFYFKYEFEKALRLLESAIEKDPDYALAYAVLGTVYVAQATTTPDRTTMRDKAMRAVTRAVSLDPNLDEAHNAMGWVKFLGDWDWAGAETSLRRAIEINPNNANNHINYAGLIICFGRMDEALRESELAMKLDPVSDDVNLDYAYHLMLARHYDQALEQARRMEELDPHHPRIHSTMARIYLAKSMFQEAIDEIEKQYSPDDRRVIFFLAVAYAGLGRRAEAEEKLQQMVQTASGPGTRYSIATVYAVLHNREKAFEWLEKAYAARDNLMIHLRSDPNWDQYRDAPRFADLLQRMGL